MPNDQFFEAGTRVLTPPAFDFVLDSELKRALRAQNFLTLVVVEARREWEGMMVTADEGTIGEVARILGHEVRDTDLLGCIENGELSLVLLDADHTGSRTVIERIVQRIDSYDFPARLRISMGAACYPTDAIDAASLRRQASSRPVVSWSGGSTSAGDH